MATNNARVCILGTPSSGKSTYLLALYYLLTRVERFRGYSVDFPRGDDKSERNYKDQLDRLTETGFLPPTVEKSLYDASMIVSDQSDKDVLRVSTKDASGEQLEKLFSTEHRKLRKYLSGEKVALNTRDELILDLMKKSKNFILFWDPDIRADGYSQTRFLENIVKTLEIIHGEDLNGLAIALLITKADAFPQVRKCYPYLFSHSGDLITKIKAKLNERFAIFPVSSLGGFRWEPGGRSKSKMASPKTLRPKNVLEPLIWFRDISDKKKFFIRGKMESGGGDRSYSTPNNHDPWFDDDDLF